MSSKQRSKKKKPRCLACGFLKFLAKRYPNGDVLYVCDRCGYPVLKEA